MIEIVEVETIFCDCCGFWEQAVNFLSGCDPIGVGVRCPKCGNEYEFDFNPPVDLNPASKPSLWHHPTFILHS